MAYRATRGVPDHHHPACQQTEAEDAALTIVLAHFLQLDRQALKNLESILKVQPPVRERLLTDAPWAMPR
ncbi:hypothetical protein HGR_14024 [Hylemonella gracilis ATCC 19624]|uniref:Uncharacterized protein n=1 Tax=Hylemonella gracilis ATCC 19624 TaxID=887062 RepID=F3KWG6_9BURK|nr:hypothetical protein HGR_14024 [Hylemonella gracilis ATCC 19624]